MYKIKYARLFTTIGTTTILYVDENACTFIYYNRYNHHYYMYKRMHTRLFIILGTTTIFICTRESMHVYLLS